MDIIGKGEFVAENMTAEAAEMQEYKLRSTSMSSKVCLYIESIY